MSEDTGLPERLRSLHPGQRLALVAVVGFLLFVGVSWATAPSRAPGIEDPGNGVEGPGNGTDNRTLNWSEYGERATLIGLQGPFTGRQGRAQLISGERSDSGDRLLMWQSLESWANFDVTPLPGGRVLTAFIEKNPTRTGFRIYEVGSDEPLREWTFPVERTHNSEVHDVEMLPSGEVLVVDMVDEQVMAVDQAGDITWQWNASDRYTAPADPGSRDWLHMNDVDRISEDRYLISVRNANQLVIVERGEGVVEVINEDNGSSDGTCRDGGNRLVPGEDDDVKCGNPDVIQEQHNPQWIGEGRVLVADSDNNRVTELRRQNGEWRPVVNYTGADGVAFNWPRDADLLANGNILVTDTFNNRVVEIDRASGEAVWSVSTGKTSIPYEADRIPYGEYPSSLRNDSGQNGTDTPPDPGETDTPPPTISPGDEGTERTEIPVITLLFRTLKGTVPVPHWANQWHLAAFLVTLLGSGVGMVWSYRDR